MLPSLNQMGKMDLVDGVPYFIGEFDGTLGKCGLFFVRVYFRLTVS